MTKGIKKKQYVSLIALAVMVLAAGFEAASADTISVQAAVEQEDVYVGQAFGFQIQVNGNDEPQTPDLSKLSDYGFAVQSLGGQKNNSESVTIINGQMNRDVRRGYVFAYQLTPKREGSLTIPSIEVRVGKETFKTQPIQIHTGKPQENDSFKLRLSLSRDQCYINEPVVLTVTWYISRNVRDARFTLPILENKAFTFYDPDVTPDPQKRYAQLPLAGKTVLGETGQGELDGRTYTTITFQKIMVPANAGTFEIPQATVSCTAMVGISNNDPFGGDDFFGMRRGSVKKFVSPSNALTLHVKDLPAQGRPADFSGLVGTFTIEASATPRQVSVGDPITLTIKMSGSDYLKSVELPSLNRQPALARDFKIPEEMAAGKVEGTEKVFTQTLRALRSNVKEIPAIELSYFDSADGRYKIARTKPIPLTVKETRVVTLRDAEGREPVTVGSELKASNEGIAYNYEDAGVLKNQEFGLSALIRSPFCLTLGAIPPAVYVLLLVSVVTYRRRQADPEGVKARRALGELTRRVHGCLKNNRDDAEAFGELLEALKNYLGDKLRMPAGALTWRDVEPALTHRGIDGETMRGLRSIFDTCEAQRYANTSDSSTGFSALANTTLELARRLERRLK